MYDYHPEIDILIMGLALLALVSSLAINVLLSERRQSRRRRNRRNR